MAKLTVEDIMSEQVISVTESTTIGEVSALLLKYQISGVLVMKENTDNELVGILTTTDLLKLVGRALGNKEKSPQKLDEVSNMPVGKVASKNVVTLQKSQSVAEAIIIMHKKNMHTFPVYSRNKIVGVIGKHDVLNIALSKGKLLSLHDAGFKVEKTILVIEDNEIDQKLIQKALKKRGLRVIVANTGKKGLQQAQANVVHLIILDVNLPDIKGDDVYQRLKLNSKTSEIPVLVLSGVDTPSTLIKHFELGAMNYLIKPVGSKQLLSQVEYALEWNEAGQEVD